MGVYPRIQDTGWRCHGFFLTARRALTRWLSAGRPRVDSASCSSQAGTDWSSTYAKNLVNYPYISTKKALHNFLKYTKVTKVLFFWIWNVSRCSPCLNFTSSSHVLGKLPAKTSPSRGFPQDITAMVNQIPQKTVTLTCASKKQRCRQLEPDGLWS